MLVGRPLDCLSICRLWVQLASGLILCCVPQLGIPTANIPVDGLSIGGHEDVASGVYFGWAGLDFVRTEGDAEAGKDHEGASRNADVGEAAVESGGRHDDDDVREASGRVFPMVMSIGWNPFYKNTVRSVVGIVCAKHAVAC